MSQVKKNPKKEDDILLVGIGASAGGLEALQELISHLPEELGNIAIVVAQHLSPTYKSMLVQLLSRQTKLPVLEVKNGMAILPNKIYITPPDSEITTNNGFFTLTKSNVLAGPKPSIDAFFHSLSQDKREKAIGVILSGTGSDGAYGIRAVKAAGGITIVQEPQTAKYNGMPIASIETGQVDLVLAPDKIGDEFKEILNNPSTYFTTHTIDEKNSSFDKVLRLLSRRAGTDFTNYKPSTILRRLEKRIAELKLPSIDEYLAYAEEHHAELDELFNTILIGVTTFFRDREAFEVLEKHLSKILNSKSRGSQVRIWCAGCASGEEAYSMAFLIAKLLQNKLQEYNIQIFATDIDEKAINVARRGVYPEHLFMDVPDDILQDYTVKKGESREIIKSIRQLILFSKHDVTTNPPFLKLDLISCRNLLIYFGQSLQQQVIPIFHYALNPDGYLFLGKSETVGQFTDLFSTIEGKAKIFQRKRGNKISAIRFAGFTPRAQIKSYSPPRKESNKMTIPEMVKETFYNTFDYPYVVIDNNMDVVQISGDVRLFLGINPGIMNSNILKLANKDLQIDLRALVSNTIKNNLTTKGDIRKLNFFEKEYYIRIVVKPLLYSESEQGLYLVIFESFDLNAKFISGGDAKFDPAEHPRIIELEHELEGVKEHLQTFIEELETANEELQSLNEELQSSNEELQSSNEELETSNEELQSTNEELQIAYTELKSASEEIESQAKQIKISEANARALLNNSLQAFILVNRDYKIMAFNNTANQQSILLYNKIMKVNDSIIDFQPSGGLERFHKDFSKALKGQLVGGEKVIPVKGSFPRWFKYNFTPVEDDNHEINIISYSSLDITDQKRIEKELIDSEKLINSIFNSADIGICVTNERGEFMKVNQAYCDIYGYKPDELLGKSFLMVLPEDRRDEAGVLHHDYLDGKPESAGIWEVRHKEGHLFRIKVTTARLVVEDGQRFKVTTVTPTPFSEKDKLVNPSPNA